MTAKGALVFSSFDEDKTRKAIIKNEEKLERCLKKVDDIGALREVNCYTFDPPMWLFNCAETICEVAGLISAHPATAYKDSAEVRMILDSLYEEDEKNSSLKSWGEHA